MTRERNKPRIVDNDEDDWEMTGQDEMNALYEECKQKRSVLDVRDGLNNVVDLVNLCTDCLENSQLIEVKTLVSSVLHFHVIEEIKRLEGSLKEV